jgi:hypothetical protein
MTTLCLCDWVDSQEDRERRMGLAVTANLLAQLPATAVGMASQLSSELPNDDARPLATRNQSQSLPEYAT